MMASRALPEFISQHETLISVLFGVAVAVGAVTTALILYSRAARIAQAMSGPKGWVVLATGMALAAGAASMMNDELEQITAQMEAAQKARDGSKKDDGGTSGPPKGKSDEPTAAERARAAALIKQVRSPKEILADELKEIALLTAKGLLPSSFADRYTQAQMKKRNRQQSPSQVRQESSVDLRSSAGQSLLLKVLDKDKTIEQQTLEETTKVAVNTKKIGQKLQGAAV